MKSFHFLGTIKGQKIYVETKDYQLFGVIKRVFIEITKFIKK